MMEELFVVDPKEWIVDQVIVWDWYDGPRSGWCRMRVPSIEFTFDLLDERQTTEGAYDRLFIAKRLPDGALADILSMLRFAGVPTSPVWVPIWKSADSSELDAANRTIETISRQALPTNTVVRSHDSAAFFGCWAVPEAEGISNWFEFLGINEDPVVV